MMAWSFLIPLFSSSKIPDVISKSIRSQNNLLTRLCLKKSEKAGPPCLSHAEATSKSSFVKFFSIIAFQGLRTPHLEESHLFICLYHLTAVSCSIGHSCHTTCLCCFRSPAKCQLETGFSKAHKSFSVFWAFPPSSPSRLSSASTTTRAPTTIVSNLLFACAMFLFHQPIGGLHRPPSRRETFGQISAYNFPTYTLTHVFVWYHVSLLFTGKLATID